VPVEAVVRANATRHPARAQRGEQPVTAGVHRLVQPQLPRARSGDRARSPIRSRPCTSRKIRRSRATGVPNRPVPGDPARGSEEAVDVRGAGSRLQGAHAGELPQQMGVNLAHAGRLQPSSTLNSANQLRAGITGEAAGRAGGGGAMGAFDSPTAKLAKLKRQLLDLRTRFSRQVSGRRSREGGDRGSRTQLAGAKPDGNSPRTSRANEPDARSRRSRPRSNVSGAHQRLSAASRNSPQREQEFQELARGFETRKRPTPRC